MKAARNCEILGYGTYLPENKVTFGDQVRYRVEEGVSQLDMLSSASQQAIEKAGLEPNEIDCFIGAVAVGPQPIPCTAPLLQERIAPDAPAASFDINSTCTSFITAFDMASRLVDAGQYKRVLIASGDVGTRFLNPEQKESYGLFSDAGVSVVIGPSEDESKGVIASLQRTWPRFAHDVEIRGGLTSMPPEHYTDSPEEYLFDMDGWAALRSLIEVLPDFYDEFSKKSGLSVEDYELVIPHQASPALPIAMKKLGIPEGKYVDLVQEYGNMVSASVPFALAKKLGEGALKAGNKTLLCGTAAGLTANALALQL